MYEATAIGAFHYLFGSFDRDRNRPLPSLVATQQSPLDHLLGDLIGKTHERRWFLVEFKRSLSGFRAEVDEALKQAKPFRTQLIDQLGTNSTALHLSAFGHFACWPEEDLRFMNYGGASNQLGWEGPYEVRTNVIDSNSYNFSSFYDRMSILDAAISTDMGSDFYMRGSGLPQNSMQKYLEILLRAFKAADTSPSLESQALIFGATPIGAGAYPTRLVPTSFGGLLKAFDEAKHLTQNSQPRNPKFT